MIAEVLFLKGIDRQSHSPKKKNYLNFFDHFEDNQWRQYGANLKDRLLKYWHMTKKISHRL